MEEFLSKSGAELFPLAAVVAVDYVTVVMAVMADLAAGLRRSRGANVPCTSRSFRRTVSKLVSYLNLLFAMTLIDVVLIVAAVYLRVVHGLSFPMLPVATTLGAVALVLIEVKSIREKQFEKQDFSKTVQTLRDLVEDPALAKALDLLARLRSKE